MKHIFLPLTAMLSITMSAMGCGGDDDDSTEPSGTGFSCSQAQPCGGEIAGDWKIVGFCPDTSKVPEEITQICETAKLAYDEPKVSGTVSFKSDNTYTQTVTTAKGTGYLVLDAACLDQGGTKLSCKQIEDAINENSGADPVTCAADGGGCKCGLEVSQNPSDTGVYSTSGSQVKLTGAKSELDSTYCVSGSNLSITLSLNPAEKGGKSYEFAGQLKLQK